MTGLDVQQAAQGMHLSHGLKTTAQQRQRLTLHTLYTETVNPTPLMRSALYLWNPIQSNFPLVRMQYSLSRHCFVLRLRILIAYEYALRDTRIKNYLLRSFARSIALYVLCLCIFRYLRSLQLLWIVLLDILNFCFCSRTSASSFSWIDDGQDSHRRHQRHRGSGIRHQQQKFKREGNNEKANINIYTIHIYIMYNIC